MNIRYPIYEGVYRILTLEPLKDIASNPDRQRLLKEFFQETYV